VSGTTVECTCGVDIERVEVPGDEWAWVDGEGCQIVEALPAEWEGRDAYEQLDHLSAEAARGVPGAIEVYSSLSAAVSLLAVRTTHRHRPGDEPTYEGEVPWCCDEPMRLRPSGWSCRNLNHQPEGPR
jgi:hypothetical protein